MIVSDPWKAAIINFFIPGVGFFYSGRLPVMIGGALVFLLSLHPWFLILTIPSILGMAMTRPEQLTIQIIESALGWSFLLGSLAYITTKYANKPIDRYGVGIVLTFMSGITSTLTQIFEFANARFTSPGAIYYLIGVAIGLLVVIGSIIAYKRSRLKGGLLLLLSSMTYIIDHVLILLPIPIGSIIPYYMPFAIGSPWFLFALIGGILIISAKNRESSKTQ